MKLINTINIDNLLQLTVHGIFQTIHKDLDTGTPAILPWLDDGLSEYLDTEYYFHHSGKKEISDTFDLLKTKEDEGIIPDALKSLGNIIIKKFGDKWNRLYDAFVEEQYKPLENYDMEEKETPDLTRTKNVKSKITVDNDVYGFNSSNSVPQSKSETSGNKLDNEETEKNTGTKTLTRHGNIGVTTSQQMLKSEIDLRNAFNFMDEIMNDVDSIMCLLVY